MNYYQGNKNHPSHLSVGAVLRNAEGKILVHHYPAELAHGYWKDLGITDFYTLMRETLEPGESLETALVRGLREEFGVTASLDDYLGSITTSVPDGEGAFQKTTLYFLCTLTAETGLPEVDEEQSIREWKTVEELIPLMRAQRERFSREDVDESSILERFIQK